MEFTSEEVRYVAELAKLDLTNEEVALYAEQLSAVLGYFEKLANVDTSAVPPTASVLPLTNVLRVDNPATPLQPGEATANATDARDDQFLVSAVLGDE